jgi:hypothetical protein
MTIGRTRSLLFVALLLSILPLAAQAQTSGPVISAASCQSTDVNAVINGPTHVAQNGDTIKIPAGVCTWTSGIAISGVGFTIVGTGTPNTTPNQFGAGTTSTTLINHANAPFFTFTGLTNGQTARVGIFTMSANGASANSTVGAISFSGTCNASGCPNARVDNINFVSGWFGVASGGLILEDNMFGVVDHTTSNEPSASAFFLVQVSHSAWKGIGANGDNSFASPSTVGTNQAFFIENNSASNVRLTDNDVPPIGGGVGGARYVCRFNSIPLMQGDGVCGAHGTAWGGRFRGQRQLEVYYNTITATVCDNMNGLLSGTGYFLSNTLTGTGCNRALTVGIPRFIQTGSPWNNCDGTKPWDKVPFSSSSACLDQPGSGAGALLQSATPVLASAPSAPCATAGQCWPNPILDPIYEAGEVTPNNAPGVYVPSDGSSTRVLANRDYYAQVSDVAQTSATSPFNGTNGTGYGTLARRPTTCTTGVGYWATDQGTWNNGGAGGVLYICGASGWPSSPSYAPYSYPHPLTTSGTSVGVVDPSSGLTATVQ